MIPKNKIVRLLGVLLIMFFPLSGGVFSGNNVVHAQGEPTLFVEINHDRVEGRDWQLGNELTLTIDDPDTPEPIDYTDTQIVWEDPYSPIFVFNLWENNFDVEPGHIVTVYDDTMTKTHTAFYIEITNVDLAANTVEGNASPGSALTISAHPPCDERDQVTANEGGYWIAYFTCLSTAEYIQAEQFGDNNTVTSFFWEWPPPPPEPTLYAEINFEWVEGWYWPLGNTVTLTIDDPDTPDEVDYTDALEVSADDCPVSTCVRFDLWEAGFKLEPGHIVTLTDGTTTKTHTALNIGITQVNVTDNTVTGFAQRGTELVISTHEPCWTDISVTADGDDYKEEGYAYWLADFDGICDLSTDEYTVEFVSALQQGPEEDTSTGFYWEPPYLEVDIFYDSVEGKGWLPGSEVTLTIDGPDINGTENYTLTNTVGADPDSTPDTVVFDLHGEFYLQPGHTVTLSDGGVTVVHEVENLEVTRVNPEESIVQGLADPYDEVLVILGDPWTEEVVFADENGTWEVYFDALEPETWGMARIPAEYGTHTTYSWVSPMPATYNINPWWSDATVRTEDNVFLYVHWDACNRGFVRRFRRVDHIKVTINGEPLFAPGEDNQYWGPIERIDGDRSACTFKPNGMYMYSSEWRYSLSSLDPGIYEVHIRWWLHHPVFNGGDWDGDGKLDIYRGTIVENTVTIVVK